MANSRQERLAKRRARKSPGASQRSSVRIDDEPMPPPNEPPTETARKATRRASATRKRSPRAAKSKRPTDAVGLPTDGSRSGSSLLTPELADCIYRLLRTGVFRYNAAQIVGVSEKTLEGWMRRGRIRNAEIEEWHEQSSVMLESGQSERMIMDELGPLPERNIYAEFESSVMMAEAEAEQTMIGKIWNKASHGDVSCAQWYLERAKPRRYGRGVISGRVMEGNDGAGGGASGDPIEELAAMLAGFRERATANLGPGDEGDEDGD